MSDERISSMKTLPWLRRVAAVICVGLLTSAVSSNGASRPRLTVSSPSQTGAGSGPVELTLFGDINQSYVIQASGDLSHWTAISTNSTGSHVELSGPYDQ